jgi:hypothetical protein
MSACIYLFGGVFYTIFSDAKAEEWAAETIESDCDE